MKGEKHDRSGLVFTDDAVHGDRARCGRSGRNLLCTIVCMAMVMGGTYEVEGAVYDPSGQALRVLYSRTSTLLDQVIAATEVGVIGASGKTVRGWSVARIGVSGLSGIMGVVVGSAMIEGIPRLVEWLEAEGYEEVGGVWQKQTGTEIGIGPSAREPGNTGSWVKDGTTWHFAGYVRALTDGNPGEPDVEYVDKGMCSSSQIYTAGGWYSDWACAKAPVGYNGGNIYNRWMWVYPKDTSRNSTWLSETPVYEEITQDDIENMVDGALQGGGLGAEAIADMVDEVGRSVEAANRGWPSGGPLSNGYEPLSDAEGEVVQDIINESIDPNSLSEMEEMADANGTSQPDGSVAYWDDWEYSPEAIATAIDRKDREREAAWENDWEAPDNGSVVTAGSWEAPERRELGSVLDTFIAGLNNLPLVSWLTGYTIELSGATSVVTLAVPAYMGGSIEVDFADYESILDTVGNGLYAVVGLACLLFLFRGRGD